MSAFTPEGYPCYNSAMPDNLWAPWRLKYIEMAEPATGDIFVDLPERGQDKECLILHRGETAFVIMNAYPYTSGHLMVAPFRPTANIGDLTDQELLEINQLVRDCVNWLTASYRPDGFNIGVNLGRVAGAGIPMHIHWHIVPRWSGDTNFMTSIADVRVLPESLEETYDRLKAEIDKG